MTDSRLAIGGNAPPSQLELSTATEADVSRWLAENPVIADESTATEAKLQFDRAKVSLDSLDEDRRSHVDPLNEQVKDINDRYKVVSIPLKVCFVLLKQRGEDYLKKLKAEREKEAEDLRQQAAAAKQAALDAEAVEREAKENVSQGEVGVDVVSTMVAADRAFAEAKGLERAVGRADAATAVKLVGGFGRSIGLRKREILEIFDVCAALNEMGLTERIAEAIRTDARAYRESTGHLPAGITSRIESGL